MKELVTNVRWDRYKWDQTIIITSGLTGRCQRWVSHVMVEGPMVEPVHYLFFKKEDDE
jgi:hypothetical protein